MRKLTLLYAILLSISFLFLSCSGNDDPVDAVCDQCTVSAPWSVAGGTTCYETEADCEFAEGQPCVLCF